MSTDNLPPLKLVDTKPFRALDYLRNDNDLRAYVDEHVRLAIAADRAARAEPTQEMVTHAMIALNAASLGDLQPTEEEMRAALVAALAAAPEPKP